MQPEQRQLPPPTTRLILSLAVPPLVALIVATVVGGLPGGPGPVDPRERAGASILLAILGITSLLLGLYWYGLPALGLRGHRALYASIGFATLGWVVVFAARLFLVSSNPEVLVSPGFGGTFLYLLLFEALSLQLWTFGLVFRSIADWGGPLTAALISGLLFGLVGYLMFDERLISSYPTIFFFLLWGVFYGFIRLRTGGILGMVIIQAMQSLTTWHILLPQEQPPIEQLQMLYVIAGSFYIIFIWRLWPKDEEDYRV
jgi:membrane protease YdiL (CAAX protease family)